MNNIIVKNDRDKDFVDGKGVMKILIFDKEKGTKKEMCMLAVTFNDYKQKLGKMYYNPLLFCVDIKGRLSYLYGCMNEKYNNDENNNTSKIYMFMYRTLNQNDWEEWFEFHPYKNDHQYGSLIMKD